MINEEGSESKTPAALGPKVAMFWFGTWATVPVENSVRTVRAWIGLPSETHSLKVNASLRAALSAASVVVSLLGCTPATNMPELSYDAVLAEIEADNVASVQIQGGFAIVSFKKSPRAVDPDFVKCRVIISPGDDAHKKLTEQLEKHDVPFDFADP